MLSVAALRLGRKVIALGLEGTPPRDSAILSMANARTTKLQRAILEPEIVPRCQKIATYLL